MVVGRSKIIVFSFRATSRRRFFSQPVPISNAPGSGRRYFFSTFNRNNSQTTDLRVLNKQITNLIRSGRINDARAVFDNLSHRNTVTWNSMISGYVKGREMSKARHLFDEMPEKDVVSWNLMISGYTSCYGSRYVDEGRHLFDKMPERDFVSWNTMISGYAKNGRMDEALKLFNGMPERNIVTWNAMITGFLHNGDVKTAIELFEKMTDHDESSLSALISGLIKNDKVDEAETVLIKTSKKYNQRADSIHAYNTLIAGYALKGRTNDARRIFDQIPHYPGSQTGDNERFKRNIISWNSMMMCYLKSGDLVSARQLFDSMNARDNFSWNTMINGYIHSSAMDEASELFIKMPNPDTLSWNSMISGFAQTGKLEIALEYFEKMANKNQVSWNSIIAGCEKNSDFERAIKLFIRMQEEGEKPDRHTFSSILSVCAETVAFRLGIQIHQQVTKIAIPDIPLNNSLITMYARCGAIIEARTVFNEMKSSKDVVSWNAMIGGYASHGYASQALDLFDLMKKHKVKPTHITFISVLNACAHAGLVKTARTHFKSMVHEFNIEPRVEHFASIVDVVGRYGEVEEAMDLINSMPVEPDKAVWGAVLGACRVHNNVDLAWVAAKELIRLEPESSAPYALLYNMYVDVGRWDEANEVRMMRERSGITKEPGYSMVDSRCC